MQQAEEIFNQEEPDDQNEGIENYYAETNNQLKQELLSLINKIDEVSQKEAQHTQNYLCYKQFESQLDEKNGILDNKISRLKSELKEK